MAFKLIETAQKTWHRLRGYELLADVMGGVSFKNDIKIVDQNQQDAA